MVRAQAMIQITVDCFEGNKFRPTLISEQMLFEVKGLDEMKFGTIRQRSFKRLSWEELLKSRYALIKHAHMESYPDDYEKIMQSKF